MTDGSAFWQRLSSRLTRLLRLALVLLSAFFALLFLYTALRRMRYPFELEWIESGILVSVRRITQGLPLYVKPSLDFVPFLYAPLYLYLAAALAKITGVSYATLRLISTLSTLGSLAVIAALVHYETRRWLPAITAAGLYAACYPVTEAWFDIGRVDSLFIFLMLAAIYCSRRGSPVLAGLMWVLVFQTKQTILPIAVLLLCADWQRPRRMLAGLATFGIVLTGSILWLNHITGGWYGFYVFATTRGLPIVWRQVALYVPQDLLAPLGITFLLVLAALLVAPPALRSRTTSFYALVSFGIYAALWFVKAHRGATVNALLPAYAWTAVLFGVALHRLLCWLEHSAPIAWVPTGRLLLLSAAFVQLFMLMYNPGRYIPTKAVLATRQAFIQQLRALPGDVYVFDHTNDAYLAGKQPHAEMEALGAVLDSPASPAHDAVFADLKSALQTGKFNAIVLDGPPTTIVPGQGAIPADFPQLYPLAFSAVGEDQMKFLTSQPQWILMPCSGLRGDHTAYLGPQSVVVYGSCAAGATADAPASKGLVSGDPRQ